MKILATNAVDFADAYSNRFYARLRAGTMPKAILPALWGLAALYGPDADPPIDVSSVSPCNRPSDVTPGGDNATDAGAVIPSACPYPQEQTRTLTYASPYGGTVTITLASFFIEPCTLYGNAQDNGIAVNARLSLVPSSHWLVDISYYSTFDQSFECAYSPNACGLYTPTAPGPIPQTQITP